MWHAKDPPIYAFDLPTKTKQDKIKFVQEIEAHQATSFKAIEPTALY